MAIITIWTCHYQKIQQQERGYDGKEKHVPNDSAAVLSLDSWARYRANTHISSGTNADLSRFALQ